MTLSNSDRRRLMHCAELALSTPTLTYRLGRICSIASGFDDDPDFERAISRALGQLAIGLDVFGPDGPEIERMPKRRKREEEDDPEALARQQALLAQLVFDTPGLVDKLAAALDDASVKLGDASDVALRKQVVEDTLNQIIEGKADEERPVPE